MTKLQEILRLCVVASCISAAARAQDLKKNPTSKFYVAGSNGAVSVSDSDKVDQLSPKSTYSAEGKTIQTEGNSNASIVLSNGTGIFLDRSTRIQIQSFKQEAFQANRSDMQEEPSVSHTKLYVEYGKIGISTSNLAAGSTLQVDTPDASASIHGGQATIQAWNGATEISVINGSATVRTGPSGDPHVISGGQGLVVHAGNSVQSTNVEIVQTAAGKTDGGQPTQDASTEMAEAATRLVYFNVQTPVSAATPSAGVSANAGAIQVFDGTQTQASAPEIVAIPVVPVSPPTIGVVSPANLTSS